MAKSVNNKNNKAKWVKPALMLAGVVIFIVLIIVLVMIFRPKDTPVPIITPTVAPTVMVDTVSGKWHGSYKVGSPAGCAGDTGTWDATLVQTANALTGTYSADGLGGSITGSIAGSDVTWNVVGSGGVTFSGSINNGTISGNFTGVICSSRYKTHTTGTFTGNKS